MPELENILVRYPGFTLGPFDLVLRPGITSIAGPNGSGKSTIMKILAGLLKPDQGRVIWENEALGSLSRTQQAASFAYVSQEIPDAGGFLTSDFIAMGAYRFRRKYWEIPRDELDLALSLTGLESRAAVLFNNLSGGEKRRACLGRALMQQPGWLLLDEPASFLDYKHIAGIVSILKQWKEKTGGSIVYISHDCGLQTHLSNEIITVKEGRLFRRCSAEEFLDAALLKDLYETGFIVDKKQKTAFPSYE